MPITYPSYINLDPLLDVDRLRALNDEILDSIHKAREHAASRFHVFYNKLDSNEANSHGMRFIRLTRPRVRTRRNKLPLEKWALESEWEFTEHAEHFASLIDFANDLPFKEYGRFSIIFGDAGSRVAVHKDHRRSDYQPEFVWFRPNLSKRLYVYSAENHTTLPVESYTAWFDTSNQYHGVERSDGLAISIRVDGVFTDAFRHSVFAS